MKLLTKKQHESYDNAKIFHIYPKDLKMNLWKIKNIVKLEVIVIICHYTGEYRDGGHSICNLKYGVAKKNFYSFS